MIESGGQVHFAPTAADARDIVLEDLPDGRRARSSPRASRWSSEEIGLNARLEADGIEVVETDLGEYIMQIRGETPSHIIAPAIHLNKEAVAADFRRVHTQPRRRSRARPSRRASWPRRARVLREKFLAADVGITGANFLIAETGSSVIVTNEGNGDLTRRCRSVHIVLASIEKLVPTLEDACTHPAPAGALGDRAGDHHLHDLRHRARAATATPTGRRPITSSCSTTAGARCWAAISATCCAASAAAPA